MVAQWWGTSLSPQKQLGNPFDLGGRGGWVFTIAKKKCGYMMVFELVIWEKSISLSNRIFEYQDLSLNLNFDEMERCMPWIFLSWIPSFFLFFFPSWLHLIIKLMHSCSHTCVNPLLFYDFFSSNILLVKFLYRICVCRKIEFSNYHKICKNSEEVGGLKSHCRKSASVER